MGTLIKRKGLHPSIVKRSVNNFFDDFTTIDLSDWTDQNFDLSGNKLPIINFNETDVNIEQLATPKMKTENFKVEVDADPLIIYSKKEEVSKNDNYIRREFNYRSFCRLPNL